MKAEVKGIKGRLADRSGLTLLEVMIAMGIFLIGSVGIIALFVTASVLHADASNRRKASFIANELLAEVRSMHFREVFGQCEVYDPGPPPGGFNIGDGILPVDDIQPAPDSPAARFHQDGGPLLLGSEWIWYLNPLDTTDVEFENCDRPRWLTAEADHPHGSRVLQPRSWIYVLNTAIARDVPPLDRPPGDPTTAVPVFVACVGDPSALPTPGFIVVDGEWMRYGTDPLNSPTPPDPAQIAVFPVEANQRRFGQDETDAVEHRAGTPVTVAREHDYYGGFYYTVQFYPLNATGLEAHVIVTIGYGTEKRFRVHTFRSIYTPLQS